MCPSCGYNLEQDDIVVDGHWKIDPRIGVSYGGKLITRRSTWTTILHTLAREQGRIVSSEALLARVSDSESNNVLASTISQLRRYFRGEGLQAPIESKGGRGHSGYWWAP